LPPSITTSTYDASISSGNAALKSVGVVCARCYGARVIFSRKKYPVGGNFNSTVTAEPAVWNTLLEYLKDSSLSLDVLGDILRHSYLLVINIPVTL